jgi:hypothetical protein
MKILNRPKCFKEECNNPAIALVNGKWLCGECFVKYQNKLRERNEALMLEA